jgi:hypothetical protein
MTSARTLALPSLEILVAEEPLEHGISQGIVDITNPHKYVLFTVTCQEMISVLSTDNDTPDEAVNLPYNSLLNLYHSYAS